MQYCDFCKSVLHDGKVHESEENFKKYRKTINYKIDTFILKCRLSWTQLKWVWFTEEGTISEKDVVFNTENRNMKFCNSVFEQEGICICENEFNEKCVIHGNNLR